VGQVTVDVDDRLDALEENIDLRFDELAVLIARIDEKIEAMLRMLQRDRAAVA